MFITESKRLGDFGKVLEACFALRVVAEAVRALDGFLLDAWFECIQELPRRRPLANALAQQQERRVDSLLVLLDRPRHVVERVDPCERNAGEHVTRWCPRELQGDELLQVASDQSLRFRIHVRASTYR